MVEVQDEYEKESLSWTWQKFVSKALSEKVECIIDAGAILVGKSVEFEIAPWIGEELIKQKSKLKGITFPNQRGEWKVYDFYAKSYIERNTRIP